MLFENLCFAPALGTIKLGDQRRGILTPHLLRAGCTVKVSRAVRPRAVPARAKRVAEAMLTMVKLEIAPLRKAYEDEYA